LFGGFGVDLCGLNVLNVVMVEMVLNLIEGDVLLKQLFQASMTETEIMGMKARR
jgi:hypothetical protein